MMMMMNAFRIDIDRRVLPPIYYRFIAAIDIEARICSMHYTKKNKNRVYLLVTA
jgi:hypothetical protein